MPMPMKYLLFSLLVSMVIPGLSSTAGMPHSGSSPVPGSPEFTSHTSRGDMRQSAADPFGFDSGFWRAEYLPQGAVEDRTDDDSSFDKAIGTTSAHTPSGTAPQEQDDPLDSLTYSDELAITSIQNPNVTGSSELLQFGDSVAQSSTPKMSDWESAAATATTNATIGFTASGPSATSAIVGFAGIMIVIGAYASSSVRK